MNNLNNHVYDRMFAMLSNKNLLSMAMTSKNMMVRVKSYLKRTGRNSSLKLLELSHKLMKNRKEEKNWRKRPRNNNKNSSTSSGARRLVF
jgi:hypothetical protein